MPRPTRRPRASVARGGLLAVGLLAGAGVPRPPTAHADIVGCRADPAVRLSDGTVVDLSAAIAVDAANVQGVAYALHIPVGVGVVGWATTGDALGARETLRVARDDALGVYDADTVVTTGTPGVGVVARVLVAGPGGVVEAGSAVGRDGQDLHVRVSF